MIGAINASCVLKNSCQAQRIRARASLAWPYSQQVAVRRRSQPARSRARSTSNTARALIRGLNWSSCSRQSSRSSRQPICRSRINCAGSTDGLNAGHSCPSLIRGCLNLLRKWRADQSHLGQGVAAVTSPHSVRIHSPSRFLNQTPCSPGAQEKADGVACPHLQPATGQSARSSRQVRCSSLRVKSGGKRANASHVVGTTRLTPPAVRVLRPYGVQRGA